MQDHVLGSDFVYDDFRAWTPLPLTGATQCRVIDSATGRTVFHGECIWKRSEIVEVQALVDDTHGLLVAACWTRRGSARPFRTFEASDITVVAGVAAPKVMVVTRPGEGYESRMTLEGQATDVPMDAARFTPDGMPGAKDFLEAAALAQDI